MLTLWQDAFKIVIQLQMFKMQIILLRGNFNNFRPKNGWKCHKTHNRPLPWQQMSKRLNLFNLFMCTQRPFTLQVISKIYLFWPLPAILKNLPEIALKCLRAILRAKSNFALWHLARSPVKIMNFPMEHAFSRAHPTISGLRLFFSVALPWKWFITNISWFK